MSADQDRSGSGIDRIWRLLWKCMVLPRGSSSHRRFGKFLPCLHHYQKVRCLILHFEEGITPLYFSLLGKLQIISTKYFQKLRTLSKT